LLLDLEAMQLGLLLDGKAILRDLPLRNCDSHSLGSVALTGFASGADLETYLAHLTGSR
jgi:hypothetical protein